MMDCPYCQSQQVVKNAGAASRQRAYAFSLTSADIFKGLGLWPQIGPHICHFDKVQLSDGDYGRVVQFLPTDLGTDAVYYGAEHGVLMAALQGAIAAAPNIHYLCSASLGATFSLPTIFMIP